MNSALVSSRRQRFSRILPLSSAVQLWDNGFDYFDRTARAWRDPTVKDIILKAAAGQKNTIPEVHPF